MAMKPGRDVDVGDRRITKRRMKPQVDHIAEDSVLVLMSLSEGERRMFDSCLGSLGWVLLFALEGLYKKKSVEDNSYVQDLLNGSHMSR
jgi:hypothetical protein